MSSLFFDKFLFAFQMEPRQLHYRNSSISYYRFGSGPKQAICIHGYGEEAGLFSFFSGYAGNLYTFYSIDLPFHGKTEWNESLIFTPQDLEQIISEILEQNNIQLKTSNIKLTLIGFSLGSRAVLTLCQSMPEKIEKLVLLAPDGLKVNSWYWLSTQTWLGNKSFRFTMKHPGWFFGFLKIFNKLKLVNASIFKFVSFYIGDAKVRKLLYDRWTTLRKLKPDLKLIKSLIRKNEIRVRLVYGKHDRIILSSVGEKFKKGIEEFCTLTVIHSGHQVLHEKHIEEILPALLY
jgi:pimeloyl-ACP methyl ester carboxylesterase